MLASTMPIYKLRYRVYGLHWPWKDVAWEIGVVALEACLEREVVRGYLNQHQHQTVLDKCNCLPDFFCSRMLMDHLALPRQVLEGSQPASRGGGSVADRKKDKKAKKRDSQRNEKARNTRHRSMEGKDWNAMNLGNGLGRREKEARKKM